MPRTPRIEFEDATYHLTARGNNRKVLFHDSQDFLVWLLFLSQTILECDWNCYSYCPMNNHYHMTLSTPKPNLSSGLQRLHSRYSFYYRKRYTYSGRLFEVYDPSIISDDQYLLEAIRYDLLNPVRVGLVKHPYEWIWSSYRETLGTGEQTRWLASEWVRSLFGDTTTPAKNFAEFVDMGLGD